VTRLTPAQIAAVAARAGFTGRALTNAVAVALAESGGNPAAVNVNRDKWRSRDRGLWQINSHWHRDVSDADAFNPEAAARHAHRISRGGRDWSPWATWPALAAVHMGRAQLAAAQVAQGGRVGTPAFFPGIPIIPPGNLIPGLPDNDTVGPGNAGGAEILPGLKLGDVADPDKGILALATHAALWVSDAHNWARVAMVAGGTVGVLLALKMLADTGAAGSTARSVARTNPVKAAAKAVPVGKAAGAVGKAAKAAKK
jgi:hypothetical protein